MRPGEGLQVGDYELMEEIGRGGMGVVYRARQTSLDRQVAVKMILQGRFASEEQLQRFRLEAEITAQLHHPNIVEVFEVGEVQGQAYFAMEHVSGGTLGQMVEEGPLPPRKCAAHLTVVAKAVQHAHDVGVLHRDLKPSNILLDQDGRVRVTDFGLCKRLGGPLDITLSGQTFGTPAYIPPEQVAARRGAVTVRSDVYSLGAILYHLSTGRPPFHGIADTEVLNAVLEEEPQAPRTINPNIPKDLETICQRCMSKDPDRRYASATAFAEDLERWLEGHPIQARPVRLPERLWLWARRKPAIALLSLFCGLALLLGTAGVFWQWHLAEYHRRAAESRGEMLLKTSVDLQARQAEISFQAGRSQEALAKLAAAVRMDPRQRQPAWRLVSALNERGFALPISDMMKDGTRILGAAFTPDGRRIVSLNAEHELRLWDVETTKPASGPMAHPGNVDNFAFTSGGSNIFTFVREDSVFIWDTHTGGLRGRIGYGAALSSTAAHPQRDLIAVGLTNGHVLALAALGSGPKTDWLAHTGAVSWLQFSQNGRLLATADSSALVRVWSAEPPHALVAEIPGTGTPFNHAELSPDGRQLFYVDGGSAARCWDLFPVRLSVSNTLPASCYVSAWSPDSSRVLAGLDNGWVLAFDPGRGLQTLTYTNHLRTPGAEGIFALDVSPDSKMVLSGSNDKTAHIWDLQSGKPLFEVIYEGASVSDARFHPNGKQMLLVSAHQGIRLRRLSEAPDKPLRLTEPGPVRRAAFTRAASADGSELLLTVHTDGAVRLLDPQTGALVRQVRSGGTAPEFSAIDAGGRFVALANTNHQVALVHLRSSQERILETPDAGQVGWIDFSRDGSRVAVAAGHRAYFCDAASGKLVGGPLSCDTNHTLYVHRHFRVRFSPDGNRLAAACYDLHTRVWELPGGRMLGDLPHNGPVYSVEFSPDNNFIVTAAEEPGATLWSMTNLASPTRVFPMDAPALDASFSANSRMIVVSATDGKARLWDVETGSRLGEPLAHSLWANAVWLRPDDSVVTRGWDDTFRVWEAPGGLPLSERRMFGARPAGLTSSADWTRFATWTGSPEVLLWNDWHLPTPAPDWLPELAEAIAGRRLKTDQSEEPVGYDTLRTLQAKLAGLPTTNSWNRWARWYFAPLDQRTPLHQP